MALNEVIRSVGLPINPSKLFPPCSRLSILGIVVEVDTATFSIVNAKLQEITVLCAQSFIREVFTKRDLQILLGKHLYVSCCVNGTRMFLNRMLSTLREAGDSTQICPEEGFYWDLQWFFKFLSKFNRVVTFICPPISYTAFVDANLQRLGGIWASRAYSVGIPFTLTQYELYNILVAVKLWASHWKDKVISAWCDNEKVQSWSVILVEQEMRSWECVSGSCGW